MAWKDDLIQGSLNGVKFFYTEEAPTAGRRREIYQSPLQDGADFVDFARATRRFSLSCYLIGDNYHIEQLQMMEVLESKGPYLFNHPLLKGYRQVYVVEEQDRVDFQTSIEEGGMVKFKLSLIEVGPPRSLTKPSAPARDYAGTAKAYQMAKFKQSFHPPKGGFLAGVFSAFRKISNTLAGINGKMAAYTGKVNLIAGQIDGFNAKIGRLMNAPGELASALANLVGSIFSLFKSLDAFSKFSDEPGIEPQIPPRASDFVIETLIQILNEDLEQFKSSPKDSQGSSIAKSQQESSISEANALYKVLAISESGFFLTSPDIDFETAQEAEEARDQWVELVDAFMFSGQLDALTFSAVMSLRAQVYFYLTNLSYTLPRLVTYIPSQTTSAIVLAYDLYGDSTRDKEIIRRNKIRNPMIIPGGTPLEVLSYDSL